jgi:hypothetical protein
VLLSCVAPLFPASAAGIEPVERLLRAAAWIWTLDADGRSAEEIALDPAPLTFVGPALTLALVTRKQRVFAQDRRPIFVRSVRLVDGQIKLDTTWTQRLDG